MNKNLPMWPTPPLCKKAHQAETPGDPERCSWAEPGHTGPFQGTRGTCGALWYADIWYSGPVKAYIIRSNYKCQLIENEWMNRNIRKYVHICTLQIYFLETCKKKTATTNNMHSTCGNLAMRWWGTFMVLWRKSNICISFLLLAVSTFGTALTMCCISFSLKPNSISNTCEIYLQKVFTQWLRVPQNIYL